MSAVSACAGTQVILNECDVHEKIHYTTEDANVISDGLVDGLLRHNDLVRMRCPQPDS